MIRIVSAPTKTKEDTTLLKMKRVKSNLELLIRRMKEIAKMQEFIRNLRIPTRQEVSE